MRRVVIVIALLSIGFGTNELSHIFNSSNQTTTKGKAEISQESTTSSILSDTILNNETVKRVIDGDTIELTNGKRVRYIGIDTPETVDPRKPVQCFGREAKAENEKFVSGKNVRLEKDISETDRYGRLLRYVYVDDVMVNELLVKNGFAHSSRFPPDVKYQDRFLLAQKEARENNRGLWAGCEINPTRPPSLRSGVSGQANTTNPTNSTNTNTQINRDTSASGTCLIKGNISAKGEKIYHNPGCGSYDKTAIDESMGEKWFCTEDEAKTAGWRQAKNC